MASQRTRILLVDDDKIDRIAVERHIRKADLPYELVPVGSEEEALVALSEEEFDIIILDYDLGSSTGLDVLPHVGSTPAIVITGAGSEEVAAAAMHQGATDYLIKDPNRNYLTVLPFSINNVLERQRAEALLRENAERFRQLIERARDLVLIISAEGTITYASPSVMRFGYSPMQITGEKLRDYVNPDDLSVLGQNIERSAGQPGESVALGDIRVRHMNGSWRQLEGLLTCQYDQPGIKGVIINARDVSMFQRVVAEQERLTEELAAARAEIDRLRALGQ